MDELEWLNRTEMLLGKENIFKLKNAGVILFGLGGVGSYVAEGLIRSGIGNITIVDKDVVDVTNINRQLIADTTSVGKAKVDVQKDRLLKINSKLNVRIFKEFVDNSNIDNIFINSCNLKTSCHNHKLDEGSYQNRAINISNNSNSNLFQNIDYVIDAIDTVSSKLCIIKYCYEHNIRLISCMGTGNKLDASKFEIADINKTSVCPLAKVIRKELKKLNIPSLKVLYSKEEPIKTVFSTPASISFVPSVAGLLIAGEVIKDIINV